MLRFAPCINNSWSNTPPSTGPGGTARARSAAPCSSTTLGIRSRDTFSCYGSSFKPMIPAVNQILRAQKPRWYQILMAWTTNFETQIVGGLLSLSSFLSTLGVHKYPKTGGQLTISPKLRAILFTSLDNPSCFSLKTI